MRAAIAVVSLVLESAAGAANATDTTSLALAYAKSQQVVAAGMVAAAERRTRAANSDLALAHRVAADARRAGDREAITVASEAIAVAEVGQREADQLLRRARNLLAARSKTVDEIRLLLDSRAQSRSMVVPVDGDVRLLDGDGNPMDRNSGALRPGQQVITGQGGRARLFIADGQAEVALGENSSFTVAADEADEGFSAVIEKGFLRARAKVRKRFELKTTYSVSTVRGTDFSVELMQDRGRVRVFEGVVAVTPVAGGDALEVNAGQQLEIGAVLPWPKPRPFDLTSIASPWESNDAAR